MEELHVICNPAAGQGTMAQVLPALHDRLAGFDNLHVVHTTCAGHASQLASQAVRDGAGIVVAVGGDGTVSEIVNGLMAARGHTPLPLLGILPAGSANDFSAALGITSVEAGLASLRNGLRRVIDVGQLIAGGDSRYFCMSAGIGIVAAIADERNNIRRLRGSSLYFLAAARTILRRPELIQLELAFDDETQETVHIGALLANNSPRSGGFTLAPGADMSDGYLDVLALRERTRPLTTARLVQLLLAVRKGTHLRHDEITQRRCQALSLNTSQPLLVQLDGELYRHPAGSLKIRLLPGALTIVA